MSVDGKSICFSVNEGPDENQGLWRLLLRVGTTTNLSADARYLYFTWRENESDIWVANVSTADRPPQ
jgi:hypothetical protein